MKAEILVQAAIEAAERSYSPYSEYAVGAALLTKSGDVVQGTNVENAVYPLTLCAERVAVFKAISDGVQEFEAIAVATRDGGSPCGSCRQVLAEFALDATVYLADFSGKIYQQTTVRALLPHAFGSDNLQTAE